MNNKDNLISFQRNILNLNKGKNIEVYLQNNVFKGILENGCNEYIIISNPTNGEWYFFYQNSISYIKFLEKINLGEIY